MRDEYNLHLVGRMTNIPAQWSGFLLAAFALASCSYSLPRGDSSKPSAMTSTDFQPGEALDGIPIIQQSVLKTAGPTSNSIVVPSEVEPPAELLPIAAGIANAVNRLREATGVEPLVIDDRLTRIAFARSADMVVRGYLSHEDPLDGGNLAGRVLMDAGYRGSLGENLFATQASLESIVAETVDGWLRSPAHRVSAMDVRFHYTGVGLLSDGKWWKVTQVFAEQRP